MNIDHTLAIMLAIGMLVLLVLAIVWVVLLIMITLGLRRVAREIESATSHVARIAENPAELLVGLFRRGDSARSKEPGNMSKWWKRNEQ